MVRVSVRVGSSTGNWSKKQWHMHLVGNATADCGESPIGCQGGVQTGPETAEWQTHKVVFKQGPLCSVVTGTAEWQTHNVVFKQDRRLQNGKPTSDPPV